MTFSTNDRLSSLLNASKSLVLCIAFAGAAAASAQVPTAASSGVVPVATASVEVRDGWVRPAVPGQSGTGAFMKLNAPSGSRLIGLSTPVAGVAEVHEMQMDGDTMRMRAVKGGLDLPAHQTVELKPGGYHVMLMDLKEPILKGGIVPLTLRFEDAKGVQSALELKLPVGAPTANTVGTPTAPHEHMH